jgi:hypothetical protein
MTIMPHSYRVSVGDQRADTPDGIRKAALLRARVLCPEPEGTVYELQDGYEIHAGDSIQSTSRLFGRPVPPEKLFAQSLTVKITVPDPPAPEAGIRWSLGWIRRYAS